MGGGLLNTSNASRSKILNCKHRSSLSFRVAQRSPSSSLCVPSLSRDVCILVMEPDESMSLVGTLVDLKYHEKRK